MLTKTVFDTFGRDLHGSLILNDDKRYDEARRVWNGLIDKCPASIVQCADQADVVHAVNFARNNNLLVAVRGGGHNVAGFGTCDGCMVIDLSPMKRMEVHASEHTARAQAGLTWGEFDKSTQAHGLATTGGLVSTTGIAGFTLGGGIGWLMRKHGLTIDNLLAAELITADGRRVIASAPGAGLGCAPGRIFGQIGAAGTLCGLESRPKKQYLKFARGTDTVSGA